VTFRPLVVYVEITQRYFILYTSEKLKGKVKTKAFLKEYSEFSNSNIEF
jgi:hypothetical protein